METNELSPSSTQRHHFFPFSEDGNFTLKKVKPTETKRDPKKAAFKFYLPWVIGLWENTF